jgi:hypothetical protein
MIRITVEIFQQHEQGAPLGIGIGVQLGPDGSDHAATEVEKKIASEIVGIVTGIKAREESLARMLRGPEGPSLVVPRGAGKLAMP